MTPASDIQRSPDIEIYVRDLDEAALMAWLRAALPEAEVGAPLQRGRSRVVTVTGSPAFEILLVDDAPGPFTGIWLRSDATPWTDDLACARAARAALGGEVRCAAGGWDGTEEGGYWSLTDAGERRIDWPG